MSLLITKRRTRANTTVVNDGGGPGESTFIGGRWRPLKDGNGDILAAEWAGLPLNTWIQWGGDNAGTGSTRLDQQLATPFGAPAPYTPAGSNPTKAHYDNFTGAGFDETNGIFYHQGGGHAGGSNNMLTKFEAKKGIHTVIIPPTPSTAYPAGYAASGNLSTADYGGGNVSNYFQSAATPAGDDKPCASHEWSGITYIPGIEEVIMPRFGWYHAKLTDSSWRVGHQVGVADRLFYSNRGGVGFVCFYIASTQRVYMVASGSFPQGGATFVCIVYDPAARDETTGFEFQNAETYANACLAPVTVGTEPRVMWYFNGPTSGNTVFRVSAINLLTAAQSVQMAAVLGRKPGAGDGANPCQYIPELDTIMMWCTVSSGSVGGATAGEMLTFNRSTLTCSLHAMSGTPPSYKANMNNKMRYWQSKKVLLFQTATDQNCYVIKIA